MQASKKELKMSDHTEQKLPNIPSLKEFIEINNSSTQHNLEYLGEWQAVIDNFIEFMQQLRIELVKALNIRGASTQKRESLDDYYIQSFDFFWRNFLGSIERLLSRHPEFALMHCRVAVEASMLIYMLHTNIIDFDALEYGSTKGANSERKPVNVFGYWDKFKKDIAKPPEERQYPGITRDTLSFLDLTSDYGIHANYCSITLVPPGWLHYPIEEDQLQKTLKIQIPNMLEALNRYIYVYGSIIGEQSLDSVLMPARDRLTANYLELAKKIKARDSR